MTSFVIDDVPRRNLGASFQGRSKGPQDPRAGVGTTLCAIRGLDDLAHIDDTTFEHFVRGF
jgi:hypothetical protein